MDSLRKASKGVCIGRNYADHITELNNSKPKQHFFFLKPTSSILPPGAGTFMRPKGVDPHYEVELALILGEQVKDLEPECEKGALDAIESMASTLHGCVEASIDKCRPCASYRHDSAQCPERSEGEGSAKGFDTFLPVSEIIAKSRIPDLHNVELYLTVNNEHRQADSAGLMLFRIPRILSDISKVMMLEKGDIVLTGTPKGVGRFVPGDIMRAGLKVGGR